MTGTYIDADFNGERCRAFLPARPPDLPYIPELVNARATCAQAIGRLTALHNYRDVAAPISAVIRHLEQIATSEIEGLHTESGEQAMVSAGLVTGTIVQNEIANSGNAIKYMQSYDRPYSDLMLRELHEILGAGDTSIRGKIGDYRSVQNRVGHYVPPPANFVVPLIREWLDYANEQSSKPVAHAFLAHYWFEAIHPFPDGNGRIGRIVLSHMLGKAFDAPGLLVPISCPIVKRKRFYSRIFSLIQGAEEESLANDAWMLYLEYAAMTLTLTASTLTSKVEVLRNLQTEFRTLVTQSSPNALPVLEELFRTPVVSAKYASARVGRGEQTVRNYLTRLQKLGIVREFVNPQDRREKLYRCDRLLTASWSSELSAEDNKRLDEFGRKYFQDEEFEA